MRAYGVTADDVVNALRRENADMPGGNMQLSGEHSEFGVKTKGEVKTVEEFNKVVVSFRQLALPTLLGDVRVEDGAEDERTFATLNGKPGISLEVRRWQSGQNTLEVAKAVKAEVEAVRPSPPAGVDMVVARDISLFIEDTVNDVGFDIFLGIVLVIKVLN